MYKGLLYQFCSYGVDLSSKTDKTKATDDGQHTELNKTQDIRVNSYEPQISINTFYSSNNLTKILETKEKDSSASE